MLNKAAKASRQSPMQKAVAFGENALRLVGTVKGVWEAGKAVADAGRAAYGFAQTVAPYAQAAVAML